MRGGTRSRVHFADEVADRPGIGTVASSDEELLSTLLARACPDRSRRRLARALLDRFGEIPEVLQAPEQQVRDLGGRVFPLLDALRRLIGRHMEVLVLRAPVRLGSPELRDLWRDRLALLPFEAFEVAYLDASRRLLPGGLKRLAEGTVARATVYPRRVIEGALRCEAAGMVLAHNHTNGDVSPSQQDLTVTRSIALSAELLDLSVHDHLIVSRRDIFSFREAGLL